jgi:hypothetical protein
MTPGAFEEYTEDVLAFREGMQMNLNLDIPPRAARLSVSDDSAGIHGGASVAVSEAQEEISPDVAVINATREQVAAALARKDVLPGPDTRERAPVSEGGYFLG